VDEPALVVDLALAASAAFLGGAVAPRLGQPAVVGYLLAGVAIGPLARGPVADVDHVQVPAARTGLPLVGHRFAEAPSG
jgi:CPA2 family monovalent cation:H+ antiporter-2